PSIWDEPFGLVPLEAMAAGCVVVATGTGGSGEYLRDRESAMLFKPGYALGMAEAVLELHEDPQLVATLRTNGHEIAAEHSFELFASGIESVALGAARGTLRPENVRGPGEAQ